MNERVPIIYEFGLFRLEADSRHLFQANEPLKITTKVFDVLLTLVKNRGNIVSKEELLNQVWDGSIVEEGNLPVTISALRRILGERGGQKKYIETISGRGYRFVARVNEIKLEEVEIPLTGPKESISGINDCVMEVSSLAVLPMINSNSVQELEYLADGLTESIINSLSGLSQLKVMARTTMFRYKGKRVDPRRVGQELGVEAVLVSELLQLDEHLIVRMELVDVTSGAQLWGEQYSPRSQEILHIQQEVANEVSEKLHLRLTINDKQHLAKRYTENSEAYRLYLKGRYFLNKRSIQDITKAVEYFNQSLELDPEYSLSYAGLADCYINHGHYGLAPPRVCFTKAKEAVINALAIDNMLSEAHTSLAIIRSIYDWNWIEAERAFKRAIKLNPNNSIAHQMYGAHLCHQALFKEALDENNKALLLDPLSLTINKSNAKILYFARRFDEAIEKCLEILEIDFSFGPAHGVLGCLYAHQGRYEEAFEQFDLLKAFNEGQPKEVLEDDMLLSDSQKKIFTMNSDPEALGALGYVYALSGRRDEAHMLLHGLKILSQYRYVEPHAFAMIYLGLSDVDLTMEWLEKAYDDRCSVMSYLKLWPIFDRVHSDSRFVELVRRVSPAF